MGGGLASVNHLNDALSYVTTVGFSFLGWSAARAWLRERTGANAWLALAFGALGLAVVLGRVEAAWPAANRPLSSIGVVAFELCGYALLRFRGALLPLPRVVRNLAAAALATGGGLLLVIGSPPPGQMPTPLEFSGAAIGIVGWAGCVTEPIVQLWRAARTRPAVQRARLRSLSGGFAGIVAILLVAIGIGPKSAEQGQGLQLVFGLAAGALIPVLAVAFVPPGWLRRRWRQHEEIALRHAVQSLLHHSPDCYVLAERGLDWAIRLIGAESGMVATADRVLLARQGLSEDEARALLERWTPPDRPALVSVPASSATTGIAVPLPAPGGAGMLVLLAGPVTPGFRLHELRRIEEYADSLSLALQRVRLHEALATVAATDALTGLPNRVAFDRLIAEPPQGRFAILAIDVDRLKLVNDSYGHEAGDRTLRAVGEVLRMGMRDGDTAARTGGDEFVAYLPGADAQDGAAAAERLRRSLHGVPLDYEPARVSIGCATGEAGDDPAQVWARADEALYRAKRAGRDRCEVDRTGGTHASVASQNQRWETIVPSLFADSGITAVYQPIVDLTTGSVRGYEALARPPLSNPRRSVEGLFSAADRLGRSRDLDWLCRKAAVGDAASLPAECDLFVNVSASALLDPIHDVDQMLLLLRWARRTPQTVVLEITEREVVHDIDRLVAVLSDYRRHGFRFAIDDVGDGHSTFEVLAAAVPEFVKISDNLTSRAAALGPQSAIRAVVAFASSSGSAVVAEGLESDTGVQLMRQLGVPLGQGFVLGAPARASEWGGDGEAERAAAL
jgi:diguanylate cyclase (GGDEF)-like protein